MIVIENFYEGDEPLIIVGADITCGCERFVIEDVPALAATHGVPAAQVEAGIRAYEIEQAFTGPQLLCSYVEYSYSDDWRVRMALAEFGPAYYLRQLSVDPVDAVRGAVARRAESETLKNLMRDPVIWVAQDAAARAATLGGA